MNVPVWLHKTRLHDSIKNTNKPEHNMSDSTANSPPLCAMCSLRGPNTCMGCGSIHYCSVDCQKQDWPVHKILCKTFKNFPTPLDPKTFRAINFP